MPAASGLRFVKMHGAGNDFVVLDGRAGGLDLEPALARRLADRRRGVGCDQILGIAAPLRPGSMASYRIWNADGSSAGQCGNGARCVAHYLRLHEGSLPARFTLDSPAGAIAVEVLDGDRYALELGRPQFEPARIPLRMPAAADPYTLALDHGPVSFGAVGLGNPHALIEVADIDTAPVALLGRALQGRPEFPEGVNVGFAQVLSPSRIRLRVYERGVGETLACGSGACAAVAVLTRRGRMQGEVAVELPGGELLIDWPGPEASVRMSGPAEFVFEGRLPDVERSSPHAEPHRP